MKVWSGPLTMMSLTSGSASSSSSGPRPSSSSTSTFSSANCSRRLRLIFSSASTSPMIGRNSSASSSLRERRRGFGVDALEQARKHLLLDPVDRGLEAFVACDLPCSPDCAWRSARRSIASPSTLVGGLRRLLGSSGVERLARSAGIARRPRRGRLGPPGPSSAGRRRSSAGRRRFRHCVVQMHSWPCHTPSRFADFAIVGW